MAAGVGTLSGLLTVTYHRESTLLLILVAFQFQTNNQWMFFGCIFFTNISNDYWYIYLFLSLHYVFIWCDVHLLFFWFDQRYCLIFIDCYLVLWMIWLILFFVVECCLILRWHSSCTIDCFLVIVSPTSFIGYFNFYSGFTSQITLLFCFCLLNTGVYFGFS